MLTRIIKILKDSPGLISGEELSRRLGITRSAIWKYVEELREAGYSIEAVPRLGYRLIEVPDLLSAAEVQHGLLTKNFGNQVYHYPSLPSTMDEAFQRGMSGVKEGAVIIAETQTRGRGRMGRAWVSPKGKGLYFSLILRPSCAPAEAARLTLLSAVAVSVGIEKCTGIHPLIKWPNDVMVRGKKLCGILTELNAELDQIRFVIVGIGINVNTSQAHLPPEAVSLKLIKGEPVSRVRLLQSILLEFEQRYHAAQRHGYAGVLREWRDRSALDGRAVRFAERGREMSGTVIGLHDDGGLLIRLADGTVCKRISGDIQA